MSKNKVNVCVIGAGRAGMIHARNFAKGIPNARLIAVADPFEDAAKNACKELELEKYYLDYKDVMQDEGIDAVIVVSPTVYHRDIVVAAAQTGKHILCEKPMAMTVEECDEMNKAVEDNKVKLQLGFMRRFDKNFMYAKERILAGDIGDIVLVKSLTHGPSIPQKWQYDIAKSNGPLAEVSSHDIDALRWYTESEFKEVYAIAGNYRCPQAKEEFPDFYDNVLMTATFENGMQGCIDGAVSVRYGYDSRVEILGTKGVLFVGRLRENEVVICNQDSGIITPFMETWRTLFIDAYRQEDTEFIESIIEDKVPRVTGVDGKMAVKVVNAGNQSILEKCPISLKN